jgi:hypothetical protein
MRRSKRSSLAMVASSVSSRRATLQALDEVGGATEQDTPSVLDEGEADAGGEMALTAAWRAEQEQVRALGEPGVAGGERHDLGLGDHRHGVEVEAVEGLAGRPPGVGEVPLDAPAVALGQFVLGDRGKEAGGGPALLVGALGEARPDVLHGGQAQLVEHDPEASGVDRSLGAHAAPPIVSAPRRAS